MQEEEELRTDRLGGQQPTEDSPPLDFRERELPRWVQVPAGIVLALLTLLCGFAFIEMFLLAPKRQSILAVGFVVLLLLPCFGVLMKCLRLITGQKVKGGLFSPIALRLAALFIFVVPIVGLFTGYYREMGPAAIWQAVMYFLGAIGLRQLARNRDSQESHPQGPKPS